MARIIIDGYNLLAATDYADRDRLIVSLARYRRLKQHEIRVIFDGTHQGTGTGDRSMEQGIEVVFSPITVTADDMIEEAMEEKNSASWIVVSSDRRIQSAARKARATHMTSQEFARRLAQADRPTDEPAGFSDEPPPWMEGRNDEKPGPPAKGKGQAARLSKQEKQRRKKLGKI